MNQEYTDQCEFCEGFFPIHLMRRSHGMEFCRECNQIMKEALKSYLQLKKDGKVRDHINRFYFHIEPHVHYQKLVDMRGGVNEIGIWSPC